MQHNFPVSIADFESDFITFRTILAPAQVDKMCAELASLSYCAVPFSSRAGAYFCWYY